MLCIAVSNQKGGVGKTTIASNVAVALGQLGLRVLAVDCDPQASLTLDVFGAEPQPTHTLAALVDPMIPVRPPFDDVVVPVVAPGVDLLPALLGPLSLAQRSIDADSVNGPLSLRRVLGPIGDRYDVALLDLPPRLDGITVPGLVASDGAIIVVRPNGAEYTSTHTFARHIDAIRATPYNPHLSLLGVLLSDVDVDAAETKLYRQLMFDEGWPLLPQEIPHSRLVSKALTERRMPVTEAYPNSAVAGVFRNVADELVGRLAAIPEQVA